MDDFYKDKIVYSEIVQDSQFYLDNSSLKDIQNVFFPEATCFIMTGKHLIFLIALLNSKFLTKIFKLFYAGGGLGGNGFRYKKAFLENLPIFSIEKISNSQYNKIIELANSIILSMENSKNFNKEQKDLDNLIYQMYDLSNEEIDFIEKN